MSGPISLEQMSRRYTHAEREGISCGTLHRGDITGWSHATSKPFGSQFRPIRPEVKGCAPISNPCKRLHEYGLAAIEAPHKPEAVCLPGDAKPHPGLDMGRAQIVVEVNERLHKHFVKSRKAKGKPIQMPKPQLGSVLDGVETDTAKEIRRVITNWLGQKIEVTAIKPETVERECDPHTDDPLPYDRPCKANNWRR